MAGTPEITAVKAGAGANQALSSALDWLGAAGVDASFFPPESHAFYPRCTLHVWTGLLCPGCGSLRALSALTRGELSEALGSNLLLTLSIPVLLLLGLRRWRRGDWALTSWVPNWGWWLALLLILGFGLIRNLPGFPIRLAIPDPQKAGGSPLMLAALPPEGCERRSGPSHSRAISQAHQSLG
jgi:hypothetical protein